PPLDALRGPARAGVGGVMGSAGARSMWLRRRNKSCASGGGVPYWSPLIPRLAALVLAFAGALLCSSCEPARGNGFCPTGVLEGYRSSWGCLLPDPPEGGLQITTPVYGVNPGQDVKFCYFGTWAEDMGVDWYEWFQDPVHGHHMRMDEMTFDPDVDPVDFPDGAVGDCSSLDALDSVGRSRGLFNATHEGLVSGRMDLEDGMGVLIHEGERWMIQSHFINVTDELILVQDVINIGWRPIEEIEKPVSTWAFSATDFALPPGEATDVVYDCVWPQDANVNMVMVHMHEWGQAYSSSIIHEDGSSSPYYNLPEWDPEWRHQPELFMPEGGIPVSQGDTVRGTCHYYNDTDHTMIWPEEMCVVEGMAWPLEEPVTCDASGEAVPVP
ncbi:MAG: hypothetical protein VX498_00380, partial [Myxococcota bacterium]|nr:hypothetical protein [Myxococcota bacterium]